MAQIVPLGAPWILAFRRRRRISSRPLPAACALDADARTKTQARSAVQIKLDER
jgi:hypothetical protein